MFVVKRKCVNERDEIKCSCDAKHLIRNLTAVFFVTITAKNHFYVTAKSQKSSFLPLISISLLLACHRSGLIDVRCKCSDNAAYQKHLRCLYTYIKTLLCVYIYNNVILIIKPICLFFIFLKGRHQVFEQSCLPLLFLIKVEV